MAQNTVQRIADEMGVSPITVTRALNSETTYRRPSYAKRAEHIRALAAKHGYRVNAAAQAMSTGKFSVVGLLHSAEPHRSHANQNLLRGIHAALTEHDLHLNSAMLPDKQLTGGFAMPKLVRELAADGLLIDYLSFIPGPMLEALSHYRIPYTWINAKLAENCVYPDDQAAGRIATEHLLLRGYRRIGFVATMRSNHYSLIDRLAGYQSAMRSAGLQPQQLRIERGVPVSDIFPTVRQWLAGDDLPEAFVTYSGNCSQAVVGAALSLSYPIERCTRIVSIEADANRTLGIPLPTVIIPFEEVGRRAVEELCQRIEEPDVDRPAVSIPPSSPITDPR